MQSVSYFGEVNSDEDDEDEGEYSLEDMDIIVHGHHQSDPSGTKCIVTLG